MNATAVSPSFTAGPWRATKTRLIVTTAGAGLPICEVWSGGVGIEQADANERLIAAAPELHQALAAVMADYCNNLAVVRPSTMKAIRAALAKVDGGAA